MQASGCSGQCAGGDVQCVTCRQQRGVCSGQGAGSRTQRVICSVQCAGRRAQGAARWQQQADGSVQRRAAVGSVPVGSAQRAAQQCGAVRKCRGTLQVAAETRRAASARPCTCRQPLQPGGIRATGMPSQQPGASREGTRWWPPLVTAAAGGTLCAGRTSQHPGEHQSQQGPRAAAKAANACPGASASARTGAECHRRPVWPPQVPSYLDAFRASVQGMRPAACALPASRAAGRRHAARAAQAAAVTTCAGRGDAVRAPSPTAGQADTVAWPCPAKATAMSQCVHLPGTGRVPAVRAHCTCKGFPQHPDLLRGSRRG